MSSRILIVAAALLAAACAGKGKSASGAATADLLEVKNTGVPGEAVGVRSATVRATVTAVDPATRSLTVKGDDGSTETFKVAPEIKRFGEIAVGDVIALEVTQGLLLEYQPPGTLSVEPQAVAAGALAGQKEPPAGAVAAGVQGTVTVMAIDAKARVVTIQGPAGNQHKVRAGPNVQLEKLKAGDRLLATYVESVAIAIEKGGSKL